MIEFKTRSERKFERLECEGLRWCYGGKGSSPPPPDYKGAAEATAASDKEALSYQTWANRPTQVDPWGRVDWSTETTTDPATGKPVTKWTQNTTLDKDLQAALDAQIGMQRDRSELGQSLMGRAQTEYGTPMDWGKLTDWGAVPQTGEEARNAAQDALYGRSTSMLDPQWEQATGDMEAKLVAQGLRPGDAAYDRAMDNLQRQKTDAYTRAQQEAIIGGGAEQQRQFGMGLDASKYQSDLRKSELAEAMQQRGWSLNEINALLTGQQVGMPQTQSFSQAGRAAATDYMGAAQNQYQGALDQYSAKQAANQGMMSGLGSIASTAAMMFSDPRLKKDVRKLGKVKGLNFYEWTYLWGEKAVGFMADEVKKVIPEAVTRHASGYDMVDYGKLLSEV